LSVEHCIYYESDNYSIYYNRNLFQAKRLHSFLGWEVVIGKRCLGLCWLHDSKQTESSSWLDYAGNSQWIQERREVRAGNIKFCLFTTLNMYNLIPSKLQWVWTVDRATCVASLVGVVACSLLHVGKPKEYSLIWP